MGIWKMGLTGKEEEVSESGKNTAIFGDLTDRLKKSLKHVR